MELKQVDIVHDASQFHLRVFAAPVSPSSYVCSYDCTIVAHVGKAVRHRSCHLFETTLQRSKQSTYELKARCRLCLIYCNRLELRLAQTLEEDIFSMWILVVFVNQFL